MPNNDQMDHDNIVENKKRVRKAFNNDLSDITERMRKILHEASKTRRKGILANLLLNDL